MLKGKRILLGVTGGVAAYKAAELTRALTTRGAEVRVIMTRTAADFIGAATLQSLSGHPVAGEGGTGGATGAAATSDAGMEHIALARWCDTLLIAPATADCLAGLASGLAGNLLGATCLALERPLLVAPAMNRAMWQHPATQANAHLLAARGVLLLGPQTGVQACGEEGPGRMAETDALLAGLERTLSRGPCSKLSLLISAGPTHEPVDPVRYLGNRSSGHMGYAIAEAAAAAGAQVTLVSGPVALGTPPGARRIDVETAQELCTAVLDEAPAHDIYISAAAVADYRPHEVADYKHKGAVLRLELRRNPDVLATVAALPQRPYLVGFAAETGELRVRAMAKMKAKRLDMIVANQIGHDEGFGDVPTRLLVFWEGGNMHMEYASKTEQARRLIRLVAQRYYEGNRSDGNAKRTTTCH